jgi:hypothetical protein
MAEVLAHWRGGAIVVSHDRELLRRMDRIVELSGLGAKVYGGNYDLYVERKVAEEAAAARELADAERTQARVAREVQQAAERKARRDAAGRRFAAKGSEPRIVLGAMAERAEGSGGRESRLAERLRAEAAAGLAEAQGRVERLRKLGFELPASGLAAGKTVLVFDAVGFGFADGPPVLHDLSLRIDGTGAGGGHRPQRRRQDDAHPACGRRAGAVERAGHPQRSRRLPRSADRHAPTAGDPGRSLPAAEPAGRRKRRPCSAGAFPVPQCRGGQAGLVPERR